MTQMLHDLAGAPTRKQMVQKYTQTLGRGKAQRGAFGPEGPVPAGRDRGGRWGDGVPAGSRERGVRIRAKD